MIVLATMAGLVLATLLWSTGAVGHNRSGHLAQEPAVTAVGGRSLRQLEPRASGAVAAPAAHVTVRQAEPRANAPVAAHVTVRQAEPRANAPVAAPVTVRQAEPR